MMKNRQACRAGTKEKGMVLVIILIIVAVLTLLGSTAVLTATADLRISSNYKLGIQAFYASEAGIEYGLIKLREALQVVNPTINIAAPSINGYTFSEFSIQAEGGQQSTVVGGTFDGLTALVTNYRITSRAQVEGTNASARIDLLVRDDLIPIFQFGIFYQDDLEILPGANMTFSGGRIHSNHSIYLNGDGATLSIDAKITSAGDIYHGHKDTRDYTAGTVQIKDGSNNYQAMSIDSNSSNWVGGSQSLWNGRVKSADHGVQSLNVPTPTGTPRDIIGTGEGSLYASAGLRIMDGVAKNKDGSILDVRYYDPNYKDVHGNLKIDPGGTSAKNVNPIVTGTFYDQREGRTMTATDVDVAKLQRSTTAMNALNSPPSGSDPGVLYVSSTDGSRAVRFLNGTDIPANGLTVASNNPVYIQGDYNTANRPAAVIGDAITVLSNSWRDANSSSSNLADRTASETTVKAAFMGGNKNTAGGQYSGGAENFIRFLENWSGKNFNYSGSLICLWQSQQATGNWRYGSPVYTAPVRVWSYGIDPSRLPPGTPRVRTVERFAWRQATR